MARADRTCLLAILLLVSAGSIAADTMIRLRVAHYDTGGVTLATSNLLSDALHQAGIEVVPVDIPLSRALIETDRGVIVDADPARAREALTGFNHLVLVEEPVHRLQFGAFVRRGAPLVNGWDSLHGRTVIAYEGSVVLDRLLREHAITSVIRAGTYTRAALMLAIGRGDVAILPRPETMAILDRYDLGIIEPSGPALTDVPLYFVLNKRFAGLAPRLADAFRQQKKRQPVAKKPAAE